MTDCPCIPHIFPHTRTPQRINFWLSLATSPISIAVDALYGNERNLDRHYVIILSYDNFYTKDLWNLGAKAGSISATARAGGINGLASSYQRYSADLAANQKHR